MKVINANRQHDIMFIRTIKEEFCKMTTGIQAGLSSPYIKLSYSDYTLNSIKSYRRLGIDAFKYVLIFLVVLIHATPGGDIDSPNWAVWFRMARRSAVPFFFIVGGYFLLPERGSALTPALKPLLRLLPVYIFWLILYILYSIAYASINRHLNPVETVAGGAAFHLWFLPALTFGLAMVGMGVRIAGVRITGLACLMLCVFGLAGSSYHDVLGLAGAARRGGVLIAPAFVFLGFCLSRIDLTVKPATAVVLVLVANALMIGEEFLIKHASGAAQLRSHAFVLSTFFIGASVFLLSKAIVAGPLVARLATLGRTSLGVYALHVMLLWPLLRLIGCANPLQTSMVAMLTFLLSTLLILRLDRIPALSRFVE